MSATKNITAGLGGGEYFGSHGAKNVLCVNTLPGATNTEDRCKGIADGIGKSGGKSSQLPLPSSSFGNPTAVAEAIKAALLKDTTIDGVITISAGDANSAANAIAQASAGDKVKLASFDMDETGLQRIKDGTQLFAIDQQPYLQGYLAVSLLNGFVNYGARPADQAGADRTGDRGRRQRRRHAGRRRGWRPLTPIAECPARGCASEGRTFPAALPTDPGRRRPFHVHNARDCFHEIRLP